MTPRPRVPLLAAAACLALGSLAQHAIALSAASYVFILMLASGVCVCLSTRHPFVRSAGVVCLFAGLSFNNAFFHAHYGQNHIAWYMNRIPDPEGIRATLGGRVASTVSVRTGRAAFAMDDLCVQLRAGCAPLAGRIRMTLQHPRRMLEEGDHIVVKGFLRPPPAKRNPADFDVASWLASKGLSGTMSRAGLVERTPSSKPYFVWLKTIRSGIRKAVRRAVPARSRDMPEALLLGDRSLLAESTRDDFARSGLMHLLAISGLHVLLVGMTIHRLLRPALMRAGCRWQAVELIRSSITLGILVTYALVSGASPSVIRAVIMTGFLLAGTLFRSTSNPLNALGGAAFVILLFDPSALFDVGFQLSFSAVIGLLMMGRGLDSDLLRRIRRPYLLHTASGISASLVATLATAPILLLHFGYVGLAGILLNLIAIPLGAALLSASLILVIVATFSVAAAVPLGAAVDLLSMLLKAVARAGSLSDVLILTSSHVPAFGILCLSALAVLLTQRRETVRKAALLLCLATPAVAQLAAASAGAYAPRMDVLFLDVGHGDAAIVRLPNNRILVVDAGNRHHFRDEGKRTVLPTLDLLHASRVDLTVISHPHADHLGGLPSILKNEPTGCVADNGQFASTALYSESIGLIDTLKLCHRSLVAGDTLNLGPPIRLYVLAPSPSEPSGDANDHSVVLKLVFGRTSFLFTGDIEHDGEDFLVDRYCDFLQSDVVKVPHHGSRTSSTPAFVSCVAAGKARRPIALISVGSPDKYGLPDEEIVARWQNVSSRVHSTYQNGSLWLQSDGFRIRMIKTP